MNWHMTRLHRSPKIEYRHTKEGGLCALHQRVTLIAGKLNATCNWECQYASAQADPATCLRVIACTLSFILALHVYELGTRWRSAMSFDRAANASGKLVKIYILVKSACRSITRSDMLMQERPTAAFGTVCESAKFRTRQEPRVHVTAQVLLMTHSGSVQSLVSRISRTTSRCPSLESPLSMTRQRHQPLQPTKR